MISSPTFDSTRSDQGERGQRLFELDANKDGALSADEVSADHWVRLPNFGRREPGSRRDTR